MSGAVNQSPASSVLLVGSTFSGGIDIGAEQIAKFDDAVEKVNQHTYSAIVLSTEFAEAQLEKLVGSSKNSHTQFILSFDSGKEFPFQKFFNKNKIYKAIPNSDEAGMQAAVFGAIEKHNQLEQQDNLVQLFNDQNQKLLELKADLESRIKKREKNINKAKQRLVITDRRIQAMHSALIALNKATSLANMETLLNDSLAEAFSLSWVRIVFTHQTDLIAHIESSKDKQTLLTTPLFINADHVGFAFFARNLEKKFSKDEQNFLNQIADTIAIAIDRISKKELAEKLRGQWEITFNAISDPICITDRNYKIVQTNQAFQEQRIQKIKIEHDSDAFDVFFGKDSSSQIQSLLGNGIVEWQQGALERNLKYYLISAHPIQLPDTFEERSVLIFHNVTQKRLLERQLVESAKLAEVGTISSSIAHELNNPLGGMLSFLQLVNMDIQPDSPFADDVNAMIDAGNKCKKIIENLLGFSRKSIIDLNQAVPVGTIVNQAIELSNLQTRYTQINFDVVISDDNLHVNGDENQLIQALRNVLQNSVESILDQLESHQDFDGQIRIEAKSGAQGIDIVVSDNGRGMDREHQSQAMNPLFTTKDVSTHSGLGLTIAHQIVADHNGKLEIFSQPMAGTAVKMSFPQSRFQGQETSF